jgi:hypothetical protein
MAHVAREREQDKDEQTTERPGEGAAPAPAPPMSAAGMLQMQRTAGNQAVQRMVLQRMSFTDVLGESISGGVGWTDGKKAARAKEIASGDPAKDKEQASKEVDSAITSRDSLIGGTIISVDDFATMKKGLTTEEYKIALKAFDDWKGDAKEKEKFLKKVPPDKMYLFTADIAAKPKSAEGLSEDKQLEASPNAAKAATAKKELQDLQAKEKKGKERLTDGLVSLLVWGVAERRTADDLGSEGILGIEQAVDAAQALVAMSGPAYIDTVLQLDLVGGYGWSAQRVQSALILKAVGARKSQYATKKEGQARKDVGGFADDIHDMDTEALVKATSTRDIGGGEGLQQKFTMSCGPTSIQITRGESDPIYALDTSNVAKHTLDYKNKVGDEQEKLLGKAAAPRQVDAQWKAFNTALGGLAIPDADLPKWQALLAWMGGKKHKSDLLAGGVSLAGGLGFSQDDLDSFKKYLKGLQTEPGLDVPEFQKRIKAAKLAGVTNDKYPLKQFKKGAVTEADIDEMWKVLFRGRDIMFGVYWTGGGGHYMVLADAKGDPKEGAFKRNILLSNPWDGKSEWLTGKMLADGNFGQAGSGWIDDIYY